MAIQLRASSSFSSVPFSTRSYTHDVFLSFRGEDTRSAFTGHLYWNLLQKGINTFIDDELTRGDEISQALLRAIEGSKLSLIIFSENYASSKWCLEELVHILGCKRSENQMVRPIFYKVDPSDVRNQRGKFGEALAQHERRFQEVSRWREALSEAANLSGWHFSGGYEYEFIDKIVEEITTQVKEPIYLDMPKCQVGLDSRVGHILEMLDVGRSDVRMVGIWGIGGIGKTTIAKAVHNTIAHKFDGSCFLANVREGSEQHGGLVNLQNILLSSIVGQKESKINNIHEGITLLREKLRYKMILLIVDDVDNLDQLETLAGRTDWFGHGSRVIITTRDKRLLIAHQVKPIYEVHGLGHHEALKLFSSNAFKDNKNLDDNEKLSVTTVVKYAKGIPLALEVLGSYLCDTSIHKWQVMLDGFKKNPPRNIQDILKVSYDGLGKIEKEVFLDIACFFKGWNRNDVIQMLEGCDRINPEHSIKVLEEKALIYVDIYGQICMHDLLEEMGKDKVLQESTEPGKRSRLWHHKDVQDVLTENTGTSKIEGMMVKMPKEDEIRLSPKCFKKMRNLKFFININGRFCGNVDYFPNQLRLLDWPDCPLKSLPSNFNTKKLVRLSMPCSRISRFGEGFKSMENLKSLNLERCEFLASSPDLSGSPNLEFLDLSYCTSLKKIHPSVGSLKKLVELDLSGCKRLEEVHPSVGSLEKLVDLDLKGCSKLRMLPGEVNWRSLQTINLDYCRMLESFPEIVGEMKYLIIYRFAARGCANLSNTDFLASLDWARQIDLSGSAIVILSECINEIVNLRELDLSGCRRLVEIPELPPSIRRLDVSDCVSLERISKLSNILERKESQMIEEMDLTNCWRLCQNLVQMANKDDDDDEVDADLFSRLLSSQQSKFTIKFPVPRSEVPKWFSCQMDFMGHRRFEFFVETLANFKWDNTGLALCLAVDQNLQDTYFEVHIHINEVRVAHIPYYRWVNSAESDHVWLHYVPFLEMWRLGYMRPLPPFTCRVIIYLAKHSKSSIKSCGVHLVMPPNEDVCMKLIRAENLASKYPSYDEVHKDFWDPKQRTDCKELYTDAQLENEKL